MELLRNQVIGALIGCGFILAALVYISLFFFYDPYISSVIDLGSVASVRFFLISTPFNAAFFAVLALGAWIGYNMATTPTPKPFDLSKETIIKTMNGPNENEP
jgi:hypothetical protein